MPGLTPLTYQILLALADGDLHGYGIIKEIEQRSGSSSAPSTGALYLALQRMEGEGLIAEATERPAEADDARRRSLSHRCAGYASGPTRSPSSSRRRVDIASQRAGMLAAWVRRSGMFLLVFGDGRGCWVT